MAAKRKSKTIRIPLMPLRGLMIFPHMVLHFDVGRPRSIAALEAAMLEGQQIFLSAQKDGEVENPTAEDICRVGTIALIKQVLNLPGDSLRVLVEGRQRAVLKSIVQEDPHWVADVTPIIDETPQDDTTLLALVRTTHELFEEYARASMRISPETLKSVSDVEAPDQLADVIAANVLTRLEDRQAILEEVSVTARLETLCGILMRETELAGVEKQVQGRIKKQIEKNQKDYYLREQIRAIQEELGEDDAAENDELRERLRKLPLPDEVRQKAEHELDRLARMAPGTPEISGLQTYIEWILDLPWGKYTTDNLDLKRARRVLDEDHYGMQQVKERVIEYLAVRRMNPVFLFDEIDKMSNDFRGDPASAMLEVLDGEQNNAFRDHYLEVPFDLSQVMFITTANSIETIPGPLRDRMEIIEVPSYTEEEKLQIAKRHLLPRQVQEHGLPKGSVRMGDAALKAVIEGYTREAGVRTLTRTIARVVRKAAVEMLENDVKSVTVTRDKVTEYLGAVRYLRDLPEKKPRVGVVNGLAYTTVGGETLAVECAVMAGGGGLKLTGQLGDVMKESAQAALSWIRAHAAEFDLAPDFYKTIDIHIHVPEGAVPKDGPSAGVTMATALMSAITGRAVRQDVAMTGEITLRGRVLPIGGVKEKMLAAYRAGIRTLLLPQENKKDLEDVPEHVRKVFDIILVENIGDVLKVALLPKEN